MSDASQNHDAAPIVIFAFNRPEQFAALLDRLTGCAGIDQRVLYVYVDGPRHAVERRLTEATGKIARGFSSAAETRVTLSKENMGLSRSIRTGVTEVVQKHGRVIVLEDDLVPSPDILHYFDASLGRFADDSRIMSVSGFAFDVPALASRETCLFLPLATSWGWATWQRAWDLHLADDFNYAALLRSPACNAAMNAGGTRAFDLMLSNSLAGRTDSWFVFWHLAHVLRGGLAVTPPHSLVGNGGVRSGTHASRFSLARNNLKKKIGVFDFSVNVEPVIDWQALDSIRTSRDAALLRMNARLGTQKRRLRSFFGGKSSPSRKNRRLDRQA